MKLPDRLVEAPSLMEEPPLGREQNRRERIQLDRARDRVEGVLAPFTVGDVMHLFAGEALTPHSGLDLNQSWSHHGSWSNRMTPYHQVCARRLGALVESGSSR